MPNTVAYIWKSFKMYQIKEQEKQNKILILKDVQTNNHN